MTYLPQLQRFNFSKRTIYRFAYLNVYSILLLLVAVGLGILSVTVNGVYLGIAIAGFAALLLTGSVVIFSKYSSKLSKIAKARQYYRQHGVDPNYLRYFLVDPCTTLVLKYLLHSVNESGEFKRIKSLGQEYYRN